MIFSSGIKEQAHKIPFNWCAESFNGEDFTEYDLIDYQENSFYDINQNNTVRFGLFGSGNKMFFENSDGSFMLNGKRIEIGYKVNNRTYMLTTNFNKKEFITYKEAYIEYNNKEGAQNSNIQSINFGYKTLYENDDIQLKFQPIISLPIGADPFIEVTLTANEKLDGKLVFFSKGKVIEEFDAPLKKLMSGKLNWTIKWR